MTLCLFFSLALPPLPGSLLPASLKCSPVRRAWDVRAAAMMAWRVSLPGCLFMAKLLMSSRRYRLVGIVSSVPSRRAGRGAGRIHPRFRHGDLPRARLVLRLVSHLVGRLVAIVLPSMCFSCVFFIPFSGGMCLLDLSPCPSRSVVSSSRLVMRLGRRRIVMCLLDLLPMAFSSRSYRLGGRSGERGGTMIFRNLFHGIFMNWE